MSDKWETTVGQLCLVNGVRQENPTNLSVAERRPIIPFAGRRKGKLFVLVELSGSSFGRDELYQDLVMAITEEYMHTPGTVTYGLRQAVLLANSHLVRTNARVSSEHRLGGVACVVLRGSEVFIAQAGWPMVYLIHGEHVQPFPDTTVEDEDVTMLGQRQTVEVRLFYTHVQPGDRILMVDGPMARQLGITRIGQIVPGDLEQAMNNLETLAPPEDCSAMVILVGGSSAAARAQAQKWAFMPVEAPETTGEELPAERQDEAEFPAPPLEEELPLPPVPVEPQVEAEAPTPEVGPEPEVVGESPWHRVQGLLRSLGEGARTLGERMLPDRSPEAAVKRRRRAARARRRRGETVRHVNRGVAVALALPILALLFVGVYIAYRNWSHQAQFKALVESARLKREIALSSAESPAVARDYWQEVIALADQADALEPNDPEVLQLRAQAKAEIDRIDGVTRLGPSYKLYEYNVPGSSPSRVVVAGLDVYVLDRGSGRVYHHALNELRNELRNPSDDQVLVQEGQPIEGQNVGRLVDIAWMKEGGERHAGALIILDRNGLLLEYDPSWEKFHPQNLGGQDMWRAPNALYTYSSNLYLLDPVAGQIFKYWAGQFAGQPDRWLQVEADLSTAIDMGIDGSIYILHGDGTLARYYGGEPASFTITRMPRPLAHADALYLDTEDIAQYIYIADSVGGRIVQLDRDGVFVRQLCPDEKQQALFSHLSGLYVDEIGGKIYYTAANALYVTDLPPLRR